MQTLGKAKKNCLGFFEAKIKNRIQSQTCKLKKKFLFKSFDEIEQKPSLCPRLCHQTGILAFISDNSSFESYFLAKMVSRKNGESEKINATKLYPQNAFKLQQGIPQKDKDDPVVLLVGTQVSAKYKGAFCEAKIHTVVKNIKAQENTFSD